MVQLDRLKRRPHQSLVTAFGKTMLYRRRESNARKGARTSPVKRCVMTQPLVVRNHKLLHGWFATALFLTGALASSGVTAAIGEQFCTHGGQDPQKGDSVACYSDAGCRFAASLGAEPVRNFSPSSAPFALARGKITGIITSSSGLITQIKKVGGSCRRI